MVYNKTIGRLRVMVSSDGAKMPNYGHGATISCPDGWNDSCPVQVHTVSVEEVNRFPLILQNARDDLQNICRKNRKTLLKSTRRTWRNW